MLVNEGGGEVLDFDGRRIYDVCVAEKGVFRFTVATSGVAGHASIPRIGDNALLKLAPILEPPGRGGRGAGAHPEPAAYLTGLGLEVDGDLPAAFRALEAKDPAWRCSSSRCSA